jgi:hypothetical protein
MEGLTSALSSIPWYAWVAIVAIVCGTIVRVSTGGRKDRAG